MDARERVSDQEQHHLEDMRPTFPGSNRYRVTPVPLVIIRWREPEAESLSIAGLAGLAGLLMMQRRRKLARIAYATS
jgi:MYXO-CTERM domain-containing protein